MIQGMETSALLDTGSMVSTVSETFYENLPDRPELKSMDDFGIEITGANGGSIPYIGYIEVDIKSPELETSIYF